ncbi:hypothetical protein [Pollutibacter soli]|uniref:hypothetical protein n=1 Tax=Pollutibacter soli TaxID=3034157 RepID=UPI0030135595
MKMVALLVVMMGLNISVFSQTDSLSATKDSIELDMDLLKDFKAMLDSISNKTNFFSVSISGGNRLFSLKNNNFNAQQPENRLAITPSVFYYHHSGFGMNATAYFSKLDGKSQFYQYAFTPSYDYLKGKAIAFGISYSYYLKEKKLEQYATPFSHELFGYIQTRKGWLRSGFSIGWGKGQYVEVRRLDTVIFTIPRSITDTTTVGLQDFSFTASVSHPFEWNGLFKPIDGLSVIPQLMLVAGAQHFDVSSSKRLTSSRKFVTISRNYISSDQENTGLRIQSAAFALSVSYFIGGFSLTPNYFISYYFPETDRPFSNIFSLTAAYMF